MGIGLGVSITEQKQARCANNPMTLKTKIRLLEATEMALLLCGIGLSLINLNAYWLLLIWLKKPILKMSANLLYLWPDAKDVQTRTR
jgi:hypothetical protein